MRTVTSASLAFALTLLTGACAAPAVRAPAPQTEALLGRYSGVIPCADCPGIRYTLTLLPGSVAVQEMTYFEAEYGQDVSFTEKWRWTVGDGGRHLVLHGMQDSEQHFHVNDDGSLTMLNQLGEPIESDLNFDLVKVDDGPP